jgi:hypothetical protein
MTEENEQIRADKWCNMSLNELNKQRDILLQKISMLSTLGINSSPTINALYKAHQQAYDHLNEIIDNRFKT